MELARAECLLTYLLQVPVPHGRKGRRYSFSVALTAIVFSPLCRARGYEGFGDLLYTIRPFNPLDGWRRVGYRESRTNRDWSAEVRRLLDEDHPAA